MCIVYTYTLQNSFCQTSVALTDLSDNDTYKAFYSAASNEVLNTVHCVINTVTDIEGAAELLLN